MPKLLRPNERISFVQTRAPVPVWRRIKSLGITLAVDGTATRLCTDGMLEFLVTKPWERSGWVRPQDVHSKRAGGSTGFRPVNYPLSNMDAAGALISAPSYLRRVGLINLFNRDSGAFDDAVGTGDFAKLIYLAAKQLGVSGAMLAFTHIVWLSTVRYPSAGATD